MIREANTVDSDEYVHLCLEKENWGIPDKVFVLSILLILTSHFLLHHILILEICPTALLSYNKIAASSNFLNQ